MLSKDQRIGRYLLLRRIGSGGMGTIYLAEDTQMNRQVAMKVIRSEVDLYFDPVAMQDTIRLFQREMRAITMLDHASILPLFDFGEEKINETVVTYMVMPFRQEGSLTDWLQRRETKQKLTPQEVAYFIAQAADALQHAHDRGLVHQDVKPSNFLVRARSGDLLPDLLLADFGIAKLTSATVTASQSIRGTPAFMAPEQWEGKPQPATDQYALATMAYLLLTGSAPFSGRMEQIMRLHFMVPPAPPSSHNPDLSPAIDAVILRALEKQSEQRFPSIAAFSQAFQQAAGFLQQGSPIPQANTGAIPSVHAQATPIPLANSETIPSLQSPPQPQTPAKNEENTFSSTVYSTVPLAYIPLPETPTPPAIEPTVATTPLKLAETQVQSPLSPSPIVALPNNTRMNYRKNLFLFVLAILLIMASVVGMGTYQDHVRKLNANAASYATSTAGVKYVTSIAALVNTNDTATAVTNAATTTAIADVNAITTTQIADNPYPSYLPGNGTLVLLDPLKKASSWSDDNGTSGGSCQFSSGSYIISQTQNGYYMSCDETLNVFSDFSFEVQLTIIQGDCGGITFRVNSPSLYYFQICQDGSYDIYNYSVDSTITTLYSNTSSIITTGSNRQNTIAVVAISNLLTFYANKQELVEAEDTTYTSGEIGLLADPKFNHATKVAFKNARVWAL